MYTGYTNTNGEKRNQC